MQEGPHSNIGLKPPDVFSTINNYFLLLFSGSCVVSSMYIQQMFLAAGYDRIGISVSALLGVILPLWLVTRRFRLGFRRQMCLSAPRPARLIFVLLATAATVVVVDQIYMISQQILPAPEDYNKGLEALRPDSPLAFAITFLGLCIMVPLSEELVFRGFVQQVFARNMGPVLAFVLAGLVFGAVHLNAHLLISISFFGVFLGFIFYATGNLTYTIAAHAVFNTIALVQLTMSDPTAADDIPIYLRDVRVFVIALVILIYLLYKMKQGDPETEPPYEVESAPPDVT